MNGIELIGWDRLRHGGLLLDAPRLRRVAEHTPEPLSSWQERELRRQAGALLDGGANAVDFVRFVLEEICGFTAANGSWQRGPQMGAEWGRRAVTGETVKPRHLWSAATGATLSVFIDDETRLGVGRGRRSMSHAIQWLRGGSERLAVLTNGRQWRLIFAGLDFDAWCEWDVELWFERGALSAQVTALRTLLAPALWTPSAKDAPPPLLEAILDSRKGQAELSAVLGERVREAVELLVQGHGDVLKEQCAGIDPAEIYRAAVRMVMRMVVVLFAESRDLLPRDNTLYHGAYGLTGLIEEMEKIAARGGNRLARSWSAWPRTLALFRLVYSGSHHEKLPVPAYGGELFAPGDAASPDGLLHALAVFENACFDRELLPDRDVHRMLERLTRTRVKLRQGRASIWIPAPVDFSDLSSEYIGILYEGLLDFELRTAPPGDPVIFLAVGNQPALPLSRLEAMDDKALTDLLEKMKDTGQGDEEAAEGVEEEVADGEEDRDAGDDAAAEDDIPDGLFATAEEAATSERIEEPGDERHVTRTRAETWARRAVEVGKLARRPKGTLTPEKRLVYEAAIAKKARQLVVRVILPGEWYVVRWGGTRKGSGTFYTRPGLAVPTVQRTLRPLAYDPPTDAEGRPDLDAPASAWTPKTPEAILALKICDDACGSGTFPVAALRFLTDALYASLHYHKRITADGEKAMARIISPVPKGSGVPEERLGQELLPCRPEDDDFEKKTKAILRRHVVERCLYGVDLDPLAVELCRLSLWIETMDRTLPFSFLDHKIKCGNSLIGAWLNQFQHYPAMAWKNREGGDKNHTNGIQFTQEARTKALKAFVKEKLTPDLRRFLAGHTLFSQDLQADAAAAHADALAVLARLHDLPVHDSALRARIYREELVGAPAWLSLKSALDLWCACWFWPADALDHAPLPTTLHAPSPETRAIAARIAAAKRFFHWELEFPDVFCTAGSGFDANLGNPPWENLQPNPEEFFSNVDPLFRTYGRIVKQACQRKMFSVDPVLEKQWLDYSADFNNFSHWISYSANPFGDPEVATSSNETFPLGQGGRNLHQRWHDQREQSRGYTSGPHPFRYQTGRLFTYKLFLEQCYALLRDGGRFGQIVPSGIYSDSWSQPLRELFLDRCRWEWLFGFENRDGIFEIHRSFKFNPIIIQKGGTTVAIRTAFMRRKLEDWERAETLAISYSRTQVDRFSPRSKTILEIQSERDLEILEKIYTNSVLLGDDSPNGWGIKYKLEFMMNTDAHLFPPRPKWEAEGYRPDEYSRWRKGDWRPISELWTELGIDPASPLPVEVKIEDCLFNISVDPEERAAHFHRVHSHLLKPGDVHRTPWRLRCAQPPYDAFPIPRADIPPGIILSREADAWIREEGIEDTALPLYEGRMIGQFDFSQKGWVSGKGRGSIWEVIDWKGKSIRPQFLMPEATFPTYDYTNVKVGQMRVSSGTNTRTLITSALSNLPCGDKVATLTPSKTQSAIFLSAILNSYVCDYQTRMRIAGLQIDQHLLFALAVPKPDMAIDRCLLPYLGGLFFPAQIYARFWQDLASESLFSNANLVPWRLMWGISLSERIARSVCIDTVSAALFGVCSIDLGHILLDCDSPLGQFSGLASKGFWRVDKDKDPELRHTVLTLVAFHDLEEKIRASGGDREKGIEAFLNQNDGEGWMLPEILRLADYGLGHDERAKHPQPVASRLGPRFYDWQLTQSPDESWRECRLHARNLLGETVYRQLLDDIESPEGGQKAPQVSEPPAPYNQGKGKQGKLF